MANLTGTVCLGEIDAPESLLDGILGSGEIDDPLSELEGIEGDGEIDLVSWGGSPPAAPCEPVRSVPRLVRTDP
jgi:hypothetical protein